MEGLLADPQRGPGKQARRMVKGYTAGVNAYVRGVGGAGGVKDPACKGAGYIRPDATPLDLWYGVYAANLLASTGVFAHQIADAAPPTPEDPGLPEVPLSATPPSAVCRRCCRDGPNCSPGSARTRRPRSAPTPRRSAPRPPPPVAA